MCDLARGIWTTHCKANIISVNVLARIIYSCRCLILRSSDKAYEITEPRRAIRKSIVARLCKSAAHL